MDYLKNMNSMMYFDKTQTSKSRPRVMIWLLSMVFVCMHSIVYAQLPTVTRADCSCLNNETVEGNGQFGQTITIAGVTGNTWRVETSSGIFLGTSPAPPAAPLPIPPNHVIPESPAGSGTYVLQAKTLHNTAWEVVITNGTFRFPLNSVHNCKYPKPNMLGDFGACVDSPNKTYKIDAANALIQSLTWGLPDGGGVFVGSSFSNPATVNWGTVVGNYRVTANARVRAYPGQATIANMCLLRDTARVAIVNESPVALACNDLVTANINGLCELNVTPDMILEDPILPESSYNVILRDIQRDTIISNGRINQAYLNKLIEVKVVQECGGNSCWGLIKFEDKSIPRLRCTADDTINCNQMNGPLTTGFPLPPDATVIPVAGTTNKFIVKNFDFCSDVTLIFSDEAGHVDCQGAYSAVITRTWTATDISGNATSCSNKIFVRKANASNITFPGNYDDILGPNPSLESCGTWAKLPNGHPDPSFTGRPQGVLCMNVSVEYTDTKLQKCRGDKAFKIIRRWIVTDECTAQQIIRSQTITVMDKTAPLVTPPANVTVGTQGLSCSGNVEIPKPITITDCSNTTYKVTYKLTDINGNATGDEIVSGVTLGSNGLYTISDIPNGTTKIIVYHYVIDDCDNTTLVTNMVTIKDLAPPVPVCDEFTFVGLNDQGIGTVTTESLDDGSWDNCGIAKLEASRMEASSCGINNTWGPKIIFCCEDVNKEFMVQLRVTDLAGNTNTCMVKVRVQDNVAPTLKNCPNNITVNCNADLLSLNQYGVPTATDLCGATLKEEVKDNGFDDCGRGSITRTFIATDQQGNKTTCSQTITVRPTSLFVGTDITWPQDHEFPSNGCLTSGTKPDQMPAGKQRPIFNAKACSQVTAEYEDLVFQYSDGFCFKILRKWTVIDFCQFDPFNPSIGKYTYTQIIKGKNAVKPTITRGCSPSHVTVTQVDNCKGFIEIAAEATDDCTSPEKLIWSYKLDIANNGTIDFTGNTNIVNRQVDFGIHKITWEVTDECGNSQTCSTTFEVKDQKKPTPYCLSEITTVIMPSNGSVTIWAKDFDLGSFDNCAPSTSLKYSFTPDVTVIGKTVTCSDMTDKITTLELRMYVTDASGNNDYCTVKLKVQDNNNVCGYGFATGGNGGGTTAEAKHIIAGAIKTENQELIKSVSVKLTSEQAEYPKFVMTNEQGEFNFLDLSSKNDYALEPSKSGSYVEGVTTLDLVLIQRHILGVKVLDSPYKIIAADANSDHKVSANDLVFLRKLILGITENLPNTPSWKFVDKAITFANPQKPFPYATTIQMGDLTHNVNDANFVAVKTGDVNTSYTNNLANNETESRNLTSLTYSTTQVRKGQEIAIPFATSDIQNIAGLQLALNYSNDYLDFVGVEAGDLAIADEHIFTDNGSIYVSYASANTVKNEGNSLFKLVFKAKQDQTNVDLLSMGAHFASEIYSEEEGNIIANKLALRVKGNNYDNFELFQNNPNPFNQNTSIGFVLPESGDISFKVYDINGTVLKEIRKYYDKGYHTIELNTSEIGTSGILFYQLDSKTHSANKKMIVIK